MFLSLKNLLYRKTKGNSILGKEMLTVRVIDLWEKTLLTLYKEELPQKALFFKQGKIWVKVSNPSVRQELQLQRQNIINKINEDIGENTVKGVIFKS